MADFGDMASNLTKFLSVT